MMAGTVGFEGCNGQCKGLVGADSIGSYYDNQR